MTTVPNGRFTLISNEILGDHTTVTIVHDNSKQWGTAPRPHVWTVIGTSCGDDLVVSPEGHIYRGLETDTRFAPGELCDLLEALGELV
jgi:hypothetical protein